MVSLRTRPGGGVTDQPTVQASVGVVELISTSVVTVAVGGSDGKPIRDHLLPFHCSISAHGSLAVLRLPTIQALIAVGAVTALNSARTPPRFALRAIVNPLGVVACAAGAGAARPTASKPSTSSPRRSIRLSPGKEH
jgi:hypothetical protein